MQSNYQPEGDPRKAKIVFVGEAPARDEMLKGHPFAGQAGRIHNECLEAAMIFRRECYTTNVFDYPISKPKGDKANFFTSDYHPRGPGQLVYSVRKGFTELGLQSVDRLSAELKDIGANVVVPLGGPALLAICGKRGIMRWRGSIIPASLQSILGHKCVPAIHPINASYGEYINRYIIKSDYARARRESVFPEIRRPQYKFVLHPTFSQAQQYLKEFEAGPIEKLTVDIEIMYDQVERIVFGWSDEHCITIPYLGWNEEREAELWLWTARVLENPSITKIMHNGFFDCWILASIHGIVVSGIDEPGTIEDTMIAHHIMYPDFRKSLDFCASIRVHDHYEYWKDMIDHRGLVEKEDA